ncbi:MAG: hypothetical protein LQ338_006652 [Usnochroma carphineum]|nr:MAG: hypothetical protein LQ338_006652 [Usnochroma carphineum]
MLFTSLPLLVLAALAAIPSTTSATRLYVSSYAGTITTLGLSTIGNSSYYLAKLDTNMGCAPNASWLQIDVKHRNLFCLDEGFPVGNGSLTSFKIKNDDTGKTLAPVKHTLIPDAPVNSAIFHGANGTQLLAVAHYAWGLTTWKVDPVTAAYTSLQHFNFTILKPGPNAARQAAAHPHQVIVDPTNRYLVVPDLGADLLRIFYVDPTTLQISPRPSVNVTPGSGPRHGVFYASRRSKASRGEIEYFLVSELSSTLTGYSVSYLPNNTGIQMTPFASGHTYGSLNNTVFAGNAPAEVALAPIAHGGHQLIVSNRNATFFKNIANPDPKNSTMIDSDTLASFTIPRSDDGKGVQFNDLTPAGGSFPRHFSLNKKGNLVAVGLQNSGRVVIYDRCTESGRIGDKVLADIEGLGAVTSIVWDEYEGMGKGMGNGTYGGH